MSLSPTVRFRQINANDLDSVAKVLARGFPERSVEVWNGDLARLAKRAIPDGLPRFGYLLEAGAEIVGVILAISSVMPGEAGLRCNLSSWYVEPRFSGYASLMIASATKIKNVTYINVSPAPPTRPIVQAQGFQICNRGRFVAIPLLSGAGGGAHVRRITRADQIPKDLPAAERDLMAEHLGFDCIVLVGEGVDGLLPLVLARRRAIKGIFGCARLIYARSPDDVVRLSRPLGVALARLGILAVSLPAQGNIAGLYGRFVPGEICYAKGQKSPVPINLGAFTELIVFGLSKEM